MTESKEWDGSTEEELFETPKEMMSMQAPSLPVSFETWCSRLRRAPRYSRQEFRTSSGSTTVDHKFVPKSVHYWSDFPQFVAAWKEDMLACGVGEAFPHLAREDTQYYTTGHLPRQVIGCEQSTHTSLHLDFFGMVNDFNLSFYSLLEPELPPLASQATEVFTPYRVASFGVVGRPDIIITDGSDTMRKVGFGEIKTQWVLRTDAIHRFFQLLPMENFGSDYIGAEFEGDQDANTLEARINVAKAITQLYHDLIRDNLTTGFLATCQRIIYCFIPPDDRSQIQVFACPIYREERPWRSNMPETLHFTAQVGLATLAWLSRRFYSAPQWHPNNLKIWEDWRPRRALAEERRDPTYQLPGSSRLGQSTSRGHFPSRTSYSQGRSPLPPMTTYPQYCTAECLVALKDGAFHHDCPNAEAHSASTKLALQVVIDDILKSIEIGQLKVIAGGNSAKCAAVRSLNYGHGVVVKLYEEDTEHYLFERELEIYDHLSDIQGIYIPAILAAFEWTLGAPSPFIIMSYGGVPLHRCTANDPLIDELTKAAVAICARGVVLDDSSENNVLVHNNKVSVIDFESAFIVDPPSPAALERYKIKMENIAEGVRVSGILNYLLP